MDLRSPPAPQFWTTKGKCISDQDYIEAYNANLKWTMGCLYRKCGDWSICEELAQEAWSRAWKHRERFEGRSSIRTWVWHIARFVWLEWIRRQRLEELPADLGYSGLHEKVARSIELSRFVDTLNPWQQKLMNALTVGDSMHDISSNEGIPYTTIARHIKQVERKAEKLRRRRLLKENQLKLLLSVLILASAALAQAAPTTRNVLLSWRIDQCWRAGISGLPCIHSRGVYWRPDKLRDHHGDKLHGYDGGDRPDVCLRRYCCWGGMLIDYASDDGMRTERTSYGYHQCSGATRCVSHRYNRGAVTLL